MDTVWVLGCRYRGWEETRQAVSNWERFVYAVVLTALIVLFAWEISKPLVREFGR